MIDRPLLFVPKILLLFIQMQNSTTIIQRDIWINSRSSTLHPLMGVKMQRKSDDNNNSIQRNGT